MRTILLFTLFGFLLNPVSSQTFEKNIVVYFASNSSGLTDESQSLLDSVVIWCNNYGHYELELSAHTDQVGTVSYNQDLSIRRKNAVSSYLTDQGIPKEFIRSAAKGELAPVIHMEAQSENPLNRRVEIRIRHYLYSSGTDIIEWNRHQRGQLFNFRHSGAQVVKGEFGTEILVPSNAFQTKSGKLTDNSEVVFELREFPSFGTAILNGLTTQSNGEILESGGMFHIAAWAGTEELALRPDVELHVQLPSKNIKAGMTVFYGNQDERGAIVWGNSSRKFDVVDTTRLPLLPMPGLKHKLLSMQVPVEASVLYKGQEIKLKIPKRPNMPGVPRKPVMPVEPRTPESPKPVWVLFSKEWRDHARAEKEYQRNVSRFYVREKQYDKRIAIYHQQMKAYREDSVRYVRSVNAYYDTIHAMIADRWNLYCAERHICESIGWNTALNQVARKVGDSAYYRSDLVTDLFQKANASTHYWEKENIPRLKFEIMLLERLLDTPPEEVYKTASFRGEFSEQRFTDRFLRRTRQYRSSIHWTGSNELAAYYLFQSEFADELSQKEQELAEAKIRLGIFEKSDMARVYQASIPHMGYVNCDRFSDYAPREMAEIILDGVEKGDVVNVCVHNINSMVMPYQNERGEYYVRVPKGGLVSVVAISTTQSGKPAFYLQKMMPSQDKYRVEISPDPTTLAKIRQTLMSL